MAINKEKNVSIQITISKEDCEQLDNLVVAYQKNNIPATRSSVIAHAVKEHIKMLVACSMSKLKAQEKQTKAKEEKNNA